MRKKERAQWEKYKTKGFWYYYRHYWLLGIGFGISVGRALADTLIFPKTDFVTRQEMVIYGASSFITVYLVAMVFGFFICHFTYDAGLKKYEAHN